MYTPRALPERMHLVKLQISHHVYVATQPLDRYKHKLNLLLDSGCPL